MTKKVVVGVNQKNRTSRIHLLRQHVPAEGDAALQGDRGKVGAVAAFRFRPGPHRWDNPRKGRAHEAQQAEIGANGLDAVSVFRALRAELQELHNTFEVIAGSGSLNARHVLYLGRKNLLRRHRNERAAVGHEELQQQHNRARENDPGHHRGTTTSREGARRASGETRQMVYAHATGRDKAISSET